MAVGEFGRSPQRGVSTSGNQNSDDGRDHWPYCYTGARRRRRRQARLRLRQVATRPARPRSRTRSTRPNCWRRSTTASASSPDTIVYNHLNQPRELVKGEVVTRHPELIAEPMHTLNRSGCNPDRFHFGRSGKSSQTACLSVSTLRYTRDVGQCEGRAMAIVARSGSCLPRYQLAPHLRIRRFPHRVPGVRDVVLDQAGPANRTGSDGPRDCAAVWHGDSLVRRSTPGSIGKSFQSIPAHSLRCRGDIAKLSL